MLKMDWVRLRPVPSSMQWKTGRKQKTRTAVKNASISPENRSGKFFPDPCSGDKSLPSFPFSFFGILF
ncbi:hypothetical protein EO98_00640 [Methanosarcina sp. 2.H.T.1A.6]|nr:hypothetical protein EO94_02935 [Methanosarcina sp. 2.H.T.1A.3]KKG18148.1 hypothetical protein EO97_10110 [Methanosarcina sp. 2.H.T.1A.15]KKG23977.1 hypothetical protein EO98_00640 [Methanosarcina sp. 2.H.T.1A.6]KKG26385.1 hypothetical protein EO96_05465 [Methanosarcina sp. 2.H.T.1A.8]